VTGPRPASTWTPPSRSSSRTRCSSHIPTSCCGPSTPTCSPVGSARSPSTSAPRSRRCCRAETSRGSHGWCGSPPCATRCSVSGQPPTQPSKTLRSCPGCQGR
jgi:hypothetical protein